MRLNVVYFCYYPALCVIGLIICDTKLDGSVITTNIHTQRRPLSPEGAVVLLLTPSSLRTLPYFHTRQPFPKTTTISREESLQSQLSLGANMCSHLSPPTTARTRAHSRRRPRAFTDKAARNLQILFVICVTSISHIRRCREPILAR
jgi:hypothetical protein